MLVQLRQKTTANGNSKKTNIDTNNKTFVSGYYISSCYDIQFTASSKEQEKVKTILLDAGYKEA